MALELRKFDGGVGWADAFDDFCLNQKATKEEKTFIFYKDRLTQLIRWANEKGIPLSEFRGRDMSRYLDMRATKPGRNGKPVSDRTRRHDARAAKLFFKFCRQSELLPLDPLADYQVPKATKKQAGCPTEDQVRELLRSIQRRWDADRNPAAKFVTPRRRRFLLTRNYAIVSGLVDTAARISELCSLTLKDYHPDRLEVTFRDTKTDIDKDVPITEAWVKSVAAWLAVRPKAARSDKIFVNEYGEDLDPDVFGKRFHEQMEFAELSGFTLHGLRHFAITAIAHRDILAAQEIAGHKSLATTQGYIHTQKEHVRQIHAGVNLLARVEEEPEQASDKPIMINKRSERQKRKRLV